MDPFVIYGDLYKSLRGAVNGAMYGNQVDVLDEATRVHHSCFVNNQLAASLYYS